MTLILRRLWGAVFLVAILSTVGAFGQGGPPVITDDPGTPPNGHWEINLSYPYLRSHEQTTMELFHLDLNYGWGDHLQLKYEAGYLIGKEAGQHWTTGVDDSLIGAKWRFLDEEKSGVDMSTFPQIGFNTTHALSQAGLVEKGTSFYLPLEIAKTFGKVQLDGEIGFQFLEHSRDQIVAGAVVGYHFTEGIEGVFEVRGTMDDNFANNDLLLNVGTRIRIADHFSFLGAVGRSIRSKGYSPLVIVFAGLQITF